MSNHNLIKHLILIGVLKTPRIINAFQSVDRANFVCQKDVPDAYNDYPLPIGYGQTISQPYTVAFMLELLQVEGGDKVLDVGAGSGWTTALLSCLVGEKGYVYGTELVPELLDFGRENLKANMIVNAQIIQAGRILGYPKEAPYDKILVSAAGHNLPNVLIKQMEISGRMVIPVLNAIIKADKTADGQIETSKYDGFVFVKLKQP